MNKAEIRAVVDKAPWPNSPFKLGGRWCSISKNQASAPMGRNGWHLVCDPFDVRILERFPYASVHKDGLLYLERYEMT